MDKRQRLLALPACSTPCRTPGGLIRLRYRRTERGCLHRGWRAHRDCSERRRFAWDLCRRETSAARTRLVGGQQASSISGGPSRRRALGATLDTAVEAAPREARGTEGIRENPRFSPDGSKLAVLFIEGMPRVAGPLQPMTPLAGVVDEKIYEQRIAAVDLRTDDLTKI